ncbi:MAG: acetate--CoA ligase family protein [Octadecabacter sp.]
MNRDLSRLFRPKSIAVVGGGAWCRAVIEQLQKSNFDGVIWPIHPSREEICGLKAYPTALDLPTPPDAVFIGINRDATIGAVERLSRMGAGGAVCFASGFGETEDGQDANVRLLKAAGDMPILGPNCYGMINALDGVSLWPDQHGCTPVNRGVAILTQSSNIAINLTMQRRGVPIAYVVTCGNQAQLSEAKIADALLDDPRVTAIGLHIEGFSDLPAWQALARKALAKGIPLIALKVGKSTEAQNATISHTASLAGSDAGASALLDHLGIARVDSLPTLLEALKILHISGPLTSTRIASISCSGGEASLIADVAHGTSLSFLPLTNIQEKDLLSALGPKVALANPLDYHTYIWRDTEAMTRAFSAMIETKLAITFLIVDFPRADICDPSDWECVIQAALSTRRATGGTIAMVATLPELMPEDVARRLMDGGVIPLNGLVEALAATEAAQKRTPHEADLIVPSAADPAETLPESDAKQALANVGVTIPNLRTGGINALASHADENAGTYVLKSVGIAHKSETGGVALSLTDGDAVRTAGAKMASETFILEEMVSGAVAEILIGIVKDPAHGFIMTLGAGGVFTELLKDSVSVLLPTTRSHLEQVLTRLKVAKILDGYRNQPSGDIDALLDACEAIQSYVLANLDTIEEVEVNPLIVTPTRAVAVDALIRKRHD